MARSKRNKELDRIEAGLKAALALLILVTFLTGGIHGFGERLMSLVLLLVLGGIAIASLVGIVLILRKLLFSQARTSTTSSEYTQPQSQASCRWKAAPEKAFEWSQATILERMGKIDWYQFEKFCAAILKAEGYSVARKGGAQPDGGVDLIASKYADNDTLIQCKHWRTWKVGESVVRQMLGSMTDFGVRLRAIYSIKQWTQPAAEFARKHDIQMVDGAQLAERALAKLTPGMLDQILNNDTHHCPKCESPMIYRTGSFKPFWGCSTYPRCRGTIKAT